MGIITQDGAILDAKEIISVGHIGLGTSLGDLLGVLCYGVFFGVGVSLATRMLDKIFKVNGK